MRASIRPEFRLEAVAGPVLLGVATFLSALGLGRDAMASECEPASGLSSCFEADNLWPNAGRTRFFSVAPAELPPADRLAALAAFGYLSRPVQLNAASPDPEGRDIRVIDDALTLALAWGFAPNEHFDLTLATPITLWQSGAGAEGVTSQSAPPIGSTAVHDPRVGVGAAIPLTPAIRRVGLTAKSRLELSIPVGDQRLYAGARGFVASPSVTMALRRGRLHAAAELGARIRRSVTFATARVGSQLHSSLGVAFDLLDEERLGLGVEAFVLPTLVSQPERSSGGVTVRDGVLAPAEWLFSVRSAPFSDRALSLQLGAGTGLPLSSEVREDDSGSETRNFAGVTTPRFRAVLAARYEAR